MPCPDRLTTGYEEYACRLTGVSVDAGCFSDSASSCVPHLALAVKRGIMSLDRIERTLRPTVKRTMSQLKDAPAGALDPSRMSPDEIEAVLASLQSEKQRRAATQKRLPRLQKMRQNLVDRIRPLRERLEAVERYIADLQAGRPIPDAIPGMIGQHTNPQSRAKLAAVTRARRKFTDDQVRTVRRLRKQGVTFKQISEQTGVPKPSAESIAHGRMYADVPDEAAAA